MVNEDKDEDDKNDIAAVSLRAAVDVIAKSDGPAPKGVLLVIEYEDGVVVAISGPHDNLERLKEVADATSMMLAAAGETVIN
jgi:hypothetical protein